MIVITRWEFFILALLALLSLGGYVAYGSYANGEPGFPLDDSWIHQTYARNLAERGEWTFFPGERSAGATSPLWVLLLAIGYWLGLSPFAWSFFLGWLTLLALGVGGFIAFGLLLERKDWGLRAGALLILEWHLVWSAASGMETALFAFVCLCTLAFVLATKQKKPKFYWLAAGALAGLSVWLRPEGLTLLAPLFLAILFVEKGSPAKGKSLSLFALGFLLLFVPYLLINYAISGSVWPNTFYAKQAEYASLLAQPLWRRVGQQLFQPLVGAGLFLLPGFLYLSLRSWKQRSWLPLLCAVWVFAFLTLFAIRLPVVYQHGRYAMPVIPIYFVLSLAGMAMWVQARRGSKVGKRMSITWQSAVIMLALAMLVLAAPVYAKDIGFIQSEMVATAAWIEVNTPPDSLIAAHDIGALGYFTDRPLLDLAGLVSPEIVPFMRDETQLAAYLDEQGADYLVTFPSWYPRLVQRADPVYQTGGEVSDENMAVYRWQSGGE